MADVNDATGSDGRAQLILVTALALAVMFVALALTLNTAIYTENLATRSSDIAGGSAALQYVDAAEDAFGEFLADVNREHNESHATLTANATLLVDDWEDAVGKQYAMTADAVEIGNASVVNGSKIVQNTVRNFTSANGTSNWTIAREVTAVRTFELNVTRDSLNESSGGPILSEPVFTIHFEDDTADEWWLEVYNDSSMATVNVTVETPSGTSETCSSAGEHVVIDLVNGTLGGNSCSALTVFDEMAEPYTVTYNHTDVAGILDVTSHPTGNGTYRIVVDDDGPARNPSSAFNEGPGGDAPEAIPYLFAVDFDAIYETARTRYNATVRAEPGDADD